MRLDKINRNILSLLQSDARITNQELAQHVNLSPSSCLNRVKKLEQAGLIGPYIGVVNLDKACRSVMAIITVKLQDQSTDGFQNFLSCARAIPELIECYTVSGSFDMFLRVAAADMIRFNQIVDELLDIIPGMVNLSSHIVLSTDKSFRGYPLESLLEEKYE
ncbi:transcriptional regulator ['Osedax' symbiont bacterium Rs2_46_30_T18]|nr:transcriptional regulator ['Osedax' symbiont bacterium Rs2_46_30_T18]